MTLAKWEDGKDRAGGTIQLLILADHPVLHSLSALAATPASAACTDRNKGQGRTRAASGTNVAAENFSTERIFFALSSLLSLDRRCHS